MRSFTDYIEEFRQKEVQFGSPLEEPQVEPFSALMPGEDPGRNEFAPTGPIRLWETAFFLKEHQSLLKM